MEFAIQDIFRRNPFGVMKLPNLQKRVVQVFQNIIKTWSPSPTQRWIITSILNIIFFLRIILGQGWYVFAILLILYNLYLIYLCFNSKINSVLNGPKLPVHHNEVFYLPTSEKQPSEEEFNLQLWFSSIKASLVALSCTFCRFLDFPVGWSLIFLYVILMICVTRALLGKPNARKRFKMQLQNICMGPSKGMGW